MRRGLLVRAIRNRDTNSKQNLYPQQTCLEKLSKLCNGPSPIPKAIKQSVCRTWLMLLPLVVHQLGLDFASRFQVVGEVSLAWVLKGWSRETDATTNRRDQLYMWLLRAKI